jgi:hypothetical protein
MKTLIAVALIGFAALFGTAGVGHADNDPYAPLVGVWQGHHRVMKVDPDGSVVVHVPDDPACPTCSAVEMPAMTIHIGLTAYDDNGDGKFFGYVKDSSDTRAVPTAVPVEIDIIPVQDYAKDHPYPRYIPSDGPGNVVTVSVKGLGNDYPFCGPTAHVCGA